MLVNSKKSISAIVLPILFLLSLLSLTNIASAEIKITCESLANAAFAKTPANTEVLSGGPPLLAVAASLGCSDAIKQFIRNGADVNQVDQNGVTALFGAAQHQQVEAIRILLENGADPDYENIIKLPPGINITMPSMTALKMAKSAGCVECVELLENYKKKESNNDLFSSTRFRKFLLKGKHTIHHLFKNLKLSLKA
jgi:ankyrin repeat protein